MNNKLLVLFLVAQCVSSIHAGIASKTGYAIGGLTGIVVAYEAVNGYQCRQDPYFSDALKEKFNTILSLYKAIPLFIYPGPKLGASEQYRLRDRRAEQLEMILTEAWKNYAVSGRCQQSAQNFRKAQEVLSRIWTSAPETKEEQYPELGKLKEGVQETFQQGKRVIQEKTGFGK